MSARNRAFTLVELMVVIGVIAVLVSLVLPSLGSAMAAAKLERISAVVRQDAAIIAMYADDSRDAYPLAGNTPGLAARFWYTILESSGHIDSAARVDPEGFRKYGGVRVFISMAMTCDPAYMRKGFTHPVEDTPSRCVYQHEVTYPSLKGLVLEMWRDPTDPGAIAFCCAGPQVTVPVAMSDGSMFVGSRRMFIGGDPPVVVDGMGIPVFSTWGGCLARDR